MGTIKIPVFLGVIILGIILVTAASQKITQGTASIPTSIPISSPKVISVPAPVYPLKVSVNGRYLVDQKDAPIFWSGDAAWSLIAQLSQSDIDYYLNDRQQKGFNVILVNLIEHKFADHAPKNIYGVSPFTGKTFITPNEAYFKYADHVISSALQRGITVLLAPLYLGYNCESEGWCAEVKAASTNDLMTWGQYVGNRYKKYGNIVWVIGGDVDPTSYNIQTKVSAFVSALQQADNSHLITAHNDRGEMAVTPWPGSSWLSFNNIYTHYLSTYQLGRTAYNNLPTLPFFQIEGDYENESSTTGQELRAQAYWTVLSGGMGYIFGNSPIWCFSTPSCGIAGNWKANLNSPGSISMVYADQLFNSLAWQNLVPDWSHTVLSSGYGSWGAVNYATASIAADGSALVVYAPTHQTLTITMNRFSSNVTGVWYDPTNGAYKIVSGSPFQNIGSKQFSPPGSNSAGDSDWVLVLQTQIDKSQWKHYFFPLVQN